MARKQVEHLADPWPCAFPRDRHGQMLFAGCEGRKFRMASDQARGHARIGRHRFVPGIAGNHACARAADDSG